MRNFCLIVFNSTLDSMHMFKILKDQRLKVEIISTPCTISAGCSRAIKFFKEDIDKVRESIKKESIFVKGIYEKIYNTKSFFYEKIY